MTKYCKVSGSFDAFSGYCKRTFIVIFMVMFVSGCGLFSNPDKRIYGLFENAPNEMELQYYNLAGALASEKPCYLISPNSYTVSPGVAPFNRSGHVVSLHRSRCFHNVARLSLRPEVCDNVKSASTWLYSGTDLNSERCREDVAAERRISGNLAETNKIVEESNLTDSELNEAMLDLRIFPDMNVLQAYRSERESQFKRCAKRYVIYSELFFDKIDSFENFGGRDDLEQMKNIEWQEHPYISMPGFTHCFLADGANRWIDRGVGAYPERESSGFQNPGRQ